MYLYVNKSGNNKFLYAAKSVRMGGKVSRINVEKLGTIASIMEEKKLNTEDEATEWAKQYIEKLNEKANTENEEIVVRLHPNKTRQLNDESKKRGLGYLIPQKVYYQLGLNLICENIQKRYKVSYDLNNILESLLYARMISPASKLKTSEEVANFYKWDALIPHHVYRSLSVFAKEIDYIQSQLYNNSLKVIKRDTTVIYYDCTNLYFESEQSEGLKQYGVSKEHRPNPIVELGLFMDKKGYPLSFCVHSGDTSETKTMIPLEEKMIKEYNMSDFIVCTDAAMAISKNKIFNSAGNKHFVTTQPIKKLSDKYKTWTLDKKGWRMYIPLYDSDTQEERAIKEALISKKKIYDLDKIDEEDKKYRNAIFFKKTPFDQEMKENGKEVHVDQILYVTYSPKYKRYQRMKRAEHIKKAESAIRRGDKLDSHNSHDYKRLIGKMACTKEGEAADITNYYIDQDVIAEEEMYDGFYGTSSDLKSNINIVMTVLKNKWEIEESFRILKTDFEARPIYVSRNDRIKAHLLTCYLTLFLYRVIEKHYMRERYTSTEIIESIRKMEGAAIGNGIMPLFEYTPCSQALQMHTNVLLNSEYITDKKLEKVSKSVKNTPDSVKRLFVPNKRPVGRPSLGAKAKEAKESIAKKTSNKIKATKK